MDETTKETARQLLAECRDLVKRAKGAPILALKPTLEQLADKQNALFACLLGEK